jgi:hyperosmotically inducible protein
MKSLIPAVLLAAAVAATGCDRPKTGYNNSGASASGNPGTATTTTTTTSDATAPAAATAPSTDSMANTGATNVVTDTVTTGKIKAAIAADSGMKDTDVSVTTTGGVVTLSGTVKSQDQVTIATNLAQRQEGVTKVESNMTVK